MIWPWNVNSLDNDEIAPEVQNERKQHANAGFSIGSIILGGTHDCGLATLVRVARDVVCDMNPGKSCRVGAQYFRCNMCLSLIDQTRVRLQYNDACSPQIAASKGLYSQTDPGDVIGGCFLERYVRV